MNDLLCGTGVRVLRRCEGDEGDQQVTLLQKASKTIRRLDGGDEIEDEEGVNAQSLGVNWVSSTSAGEWTRCSASVLKGV